MAAPSVLFASCTNFSIENLIKDILHVDILPAPLKPLEEITAYLWDVDTKYYTATVNLCLTNQKTIGTEEFAESVQAIVFICDSSHEESFKLLESWMPFVKVIRPSVQLLVCPKCSPTDVVPRSQVQEWCLDNQFELVELEPEVESDDEEEDEGFKETVGVARIVQALHAHPWPNLVMKESRPFHSQFLRNGLIAKNDLNCVEDNDASSSNPEPENSISSNEEQTNDDCLLGTSNDAKTLDEQIDALVGQDTAAFDCIGDDDDDESFEKLFEAMNLMKEKTQNLDPQSRKLYAEKVAISFWKAVGGDENEIAGLDSDNIDELD